MKSPFADCEAILIREPATSTFRGEQYAYIYNCYECEQTKERFTTTALDEVNISQIYNQYRVRYGIPFPDDIRRIKELYGLTNSNLSLILGFGENQIANYLLGEIPNKANGKTLSAIMEGEVFGVYVENARGQLKEKTYNKIRERLSELKRASRDVSFDVIYRRKERDIFNGFAYQDPEILREVILYILFLMGGTYKSKLNKILFYSDMVSYREKGSAITGLSYMANRYGTIPFRSDKIYPQLEIPQITFFIDGRECTQYVPDDNFVPEKLSEDSLSIIRSVCEIFKNVSCEQITELNHQEKVWIDYQQTNRPISFREAFFLMKA